MGGRPASRLGLLALALLAGCVSLPPRSGTPGPEAHLVPGVPPARFEEDRCGPGSLALVLGAHGDAVPERELDAALPKAPGGGVLSVDLLLAARQRGFDAALVAGTAEILESEIDSGRPAILMLRLLDAPGTRRDIYHYVVADGADAPRRLVRLHFGDGKVRWTRLESIEKSWKGAGHALLLVWPRDATDAALRQGVALESAGRVEEATALYRRVLVVRPRSVRAWVDLGNAEAGRGRRDDAEAAYRRALEVSPDDVDALNNLAWLLLEREERLEEAEALAARAASTPGASRPLARETLGRIQLARGRCAEAALTFDEALAAADAIPEPTRARLREGRDRALACRRPP